eukprot:TRINITY_DN800_c0_g2_i1.p1 TRINITY_DN800_c0_g2~~TRINITY_DN800_c0_g2_i1.p1  ORF type:complete len:322 (-),score=38.99 TRINITY_DN800_c0_g2_i1:157-1122(-)
MEPFTMYSCAHRRKCPETSQIYLLRCFREHLAKIRVDKTSPIKTGGALYNALQIYKLPKKHPIIERSMPGDMYTNSVIVQIADLKFLFTGGGPRLSATSSAKLLNLDQYGIEEVKSMLVARQSHSMAAIFTYNTFVYAVGGKNKKGFLSSCEVYDLLNNKWRLTASLNEPKTVRCLFPYQNRFLYAFGGVGLNTSNYTVFNYKTIERLDVMEEEEGWQKIELDANEGVSYVLWDQEDLALTASAFKPLNPDEIMIFRSNPLIWNVKYSTLRYREIPGINDELGPPVLVGNGYMYFTHDSNSLKVIYSHFTKRYAKINRPAA